MFDVASRGPLAGGLRDIDSRRSFAKLTLHFSSIAVIAYVVTVTQSAWVRLPLQIALGFIFAHGLELQHECLHHNMLRSGRSNRLVGILLGVPMLVSYTHYQRQHLHHHRFVGTRRDKEIFDYEPVQLASVGGFVTRAWNLARIPTVLLTFIGMLQNTFPPVFGSNATMKRRVKQEYGILISVLGIAVLVTLFLGSDVFVKVWFLPWLVVGELVHFLIELPEHMRCEGCSPDTLQNTRSYRTNPLWQYVINGNNFHIEHHLAPRIAVHNLTKVHETIRQHARHVESSYWAAIRSALLGTKTSASRTSPDESRVQS